MGKSRNTERRICRYPDCGALLSRHNKGTMCWTHDNPREDIILTRHATRK